MFGSARTRHTIPLPRRIGPHTLAPGSSGRYIVIIIARVASKAVAAHNSVAGIRACQVEAIRVLHTAFCGRDDVFRVWCEKERYHHGPTRPQILGSATPSRNEWHGTPMA